MTYLYYFLIIESLFLLFLPATIKNVIIIDKLYRKMSN